MFMTPTRQEPAVREPPPLLRMNLHQWQQQQHQHQHQQELEQLEQLSPLGLPLATYVEEGLEEQLQQQSPPYTPSPPSDLTVARLEGAGQLAASRDLCMAHLLLAGDQYFSPRSRACASAQASTLTSTLSSPEQNKPEFT